MTELVALVLAHPGAAFILLLTAAGVYSCVIESAPMLQRRKLRHRERMAEIEMHTQVARALAAAPDEVQRSELAQQ